MPMTSLIPFEVKHLALGSHDQQSEDVCLSLVEISRQTDMGKHTSFF